MNLSELLNGPIGQSVVNNIAGQLGMNEQEAKSAVGLALPVILSGMERNVRTPQGAESLNNALNDSRHDGNLLNNLAGLFGGGAQEISRDGDGILGHIFGTQRKDVEQGISKKTGISLEKIGPMLALLAPIVMAYLGKQKRQTNTNAGGLGDLLGGMLGGGTQKKSGGLMGMLGGMLDKNKDGNVLDDILGMIK